MLRATIDRKKLLEAMRRVKPAVQRKASLPILRSVRVKAWGNTLEICGTDLELGIRAQVLAENVEPGEVIVGHAELLKVLAKLKGFIKSD